MVALASSEPLRQRLHRRVPELAAHAGRADLALVEQLVGRADQLVVVQRQHDRDAGLVERARGSTATAGGRRCGGGRRPAGTRSMAAAMPRCACNDHTMRPTILVRSTRPAGGSSNSTNDGNVSASSTWVFSGWSMPQKPTVAPACSWSAAEVLHVALGPALAVEELVDVEDAHRSARAQASIPPTLDHGRQHRLGQLRPADEQVGQPRVGAGCSARGDPSAREVWSPAAGADGDRGRRVPLVLTTAVQVDVGLAQQDARGLGAGGAHRHQLGAEPLGHRRGDGRAGGCGSRRGAAGHRGPAGTEAAGSETEHLARSGQGDGAGHQRGRPTQSATWTAQSTRGGSPNSRVPSSGSMIQTRSAARRASLSALSSDSTWSSGRSDRQALEEVLVRLVVAGLLELVARPGPTRAGRAGARRLQRPALAASAVSSGKAVTGRPT